MTDSDDEELDEDVAPAAPVTMETLLTGLGLEDCIPLLQAEKVDTAL